MGCLYFDIFEKIISIGIENGILTFQDKKSLFLTCRDFYFITRRHNRFLAIQVVDKHFKKVRSRQLLTTIKNDFSRPPYFLIGPNERTKFLSYGSLDEYNRMTYSFTFTDIENTIAPSHLTEILQQNYDTSGIFKFEISRYGDILRSMVIHGKNITKVVIKSGGQVIYNTYYLNAGLVNLKPFSSGIVLLVIHYTAITIEIHAQKVYHCYGLYLYLQNDDKRFLMCNPHKIDCNVLRSGKMYTQLEYNGGGFCSLIE